MEAFEYGIYDLNVQLVCIYIDIALFREKNSTGPRWKWDNCQNV